jgi:hypothetical protein
MYLAQVVQARSNGPIPKTAICVVNISRYDNASFMGVHVYTAWILRLYSCCGHKYGHTGHKTWYHILHYDSQCISYITGSPDMTEVCYKNRPTITVQDHKSHHTKPTPELLRYNLMSSVLRYVNGTVDV